MGRNKVVEIYGCPTSDLRLAWKAISEEQNCPFSGKKCFKIRKSFPDQTIGTCTVAHGRSAVPVIICPNRMLDRGKIFIDCLHLLTKHEPGNDYHVIPEVAVPGGSVDWVLASVSGNRVCDFVGIEIQTLDTSGSVWPFRQEALTELGVTVPGAEKKTFGMNWRMTAKTILMQMHHKADTFSSMGKHLVLTVQSPLLEYMEREFDFDHFQNPADLSDTVHFHSYNFGESDQNERSSLILDDRRSTDVAGIERSLGMKGEAAIEVELLIGRLEGKLSPDTLFNPFAF